MKATPSDEVKHVGTYFARDHGLSVLLQRQGEGYPWTVLAPGAKVATAHTLVSLPGYRSLIELENKLHLTLWGNLPEFSPSPPVLESAVMLHVPQADADLDFTLDRGRVVVTNRKAPAGPARLRLRFLGQVWRLELPDDGCEVALELWGKPGAPGQGPPLTCLGLFTNGRVLVRTPREDLDLGDHSRLSWHNVEPEKTYKTLLPEAPAWWANPPNPKAPPVNKALRSLLDWSDQLNPGPNKAAPDDSAAVVSRIRNQVADVKDPDNQDVGVLFLAALDEVESLVSFLGDPQDSNVRGCAAYALQTWLCRGSENAADLTLVLTRRGNSPNEAALIVRLLHAYPNDALDQVKTYGELVAFLDHKNVLVRCLAWWHLSRLGDSERLPPEAREIEYGPTWPAAKRQPAVEKWKKLLESGQVPVPPRR